MGLYILYMLQRIFFAESKFKFFILPETLLTVKVHITLNNSLESFGFQLLFVFKLKLLRGLLWCIFNKFCLILRNLLPASEYNKCSSRVVQKFFRKTMQKLREKLSVLELGHLWKYRHPWILREATTPSNIHCCVLNAILKQWHKNHVPYRLQMSLVKFVRVCGISRMMLKCCKIMQKTGKF